MKTLEDRQRDTDEGWQQREAREIDRLLAGIDWTDAPPTTLAPIRLKPATFPRDSFTVTVHGMINGVRHTRKISVLAKDQNQAEWLGVAAVWEGATIKHT